MTDTITKDQAVWFSETFSLVVDNIERAVVGKRYAVSLAVTCLVSGGHLLLEDLPGTGKTMLAKAIAKSVLGTQARIQFTPDLSPTDIIGTRVYDQRFARFEFSPGPVFNAIVLADEINRALPRTQAALLEVMEEGSVTVDGVSHPVGPPFMVIATQNPIDHEGTHPLPMAQMDRFLMRTTLGYPDYDTTLGLLADAANRNRADAVAPLLSTKVLSEMSLLASMVRIDGPVLRYIADITEATRRAPELGLGVSLRGTLAHVRAAKTWAAASGRSFVTPEDVRALAAPVLEHRLPLEPAAVASGMTSASVLQRILNEVPAPLQSTSSAPAVASV